MQKRHLRRALAAVVTSVAAFGSLAAPSAQAAPMDAAAFVANATDLANGTISAALFGCVGAASGNPVAPHTAVSAGIDAGQASFTCEDTSLTPYGLTVSVRIQYWNGTAWVDVAGSRQASNWAGVAGTATGAASTTFTYPTGSPYLNRFHRALGCFATTTGRGACIPSVEVWPMDN